jgi:hypothetical protein
MKPYNYTHMKFKTFYYFMPLVLFIGVESSSMAQTIESDSKIISLDVNYCKIYDLRNSDNGRPKDKRASVYLHSSKKRKKQLTKRGANSFVPLDVSNNDRLEFKYSWRKNPIKIKLDNVGDLNKLRVSDQKTSDKIEYLHGVVYLKDGPAQGVKVTSDTVTVLTDVMGRYAFKYSSGDIHLKYNYKIKTQLGQENAQRTATLTVNTGDDKHARVDVFFDDDKKDIVPAK